MQTDPENQVLEAEKALANPSIKFRQTIKERTADAIDTSSSEGEVELFAVVKVEGASTGVSRVTKFTLGELYGYNQSAAIQFASELIIIGKFITEISLIKGDDLEYDLKVTSLWGRFKKLNRFIGISEFHDELIASFQQLAAQEALAIPSAEKLSVLKAAVEKLGLKVRLSDETLDNVYDALELAGFDLRPAF